MRTKELKISQNTGLDIESCLIEDSRDYVFGALSGIVHENRNTLGDWRLFPQTDESQTHKYFDDYGCVSNGCDNSCAMQFSLLDSSNLIRNEDREWLKYNGYFDENGKINFDNRALILLSNTRPGVGNSYKNVWDAARSYGLWPQDSTPYNPDWNQRQFYDKSDFPPDSYEVGKEFLKRFYIQYEKVPVTPSHLKRALKHAPIQIGIPICSDYNSNTLVGSCNIAATHNVTLTHIDEKGIYHIYDSYNPFNKILSKTYKIDFAYKGVITPVISISGKKKEDFIFTKNLEFGDYDNDVVQLGKRLIEENVWSATQYNPPGPHYNQEIAQGVRNYQNKYKITNWFQDMWYQGRYFHDKTRNHMNLNANSFKL